MRPPSTILPAALVALDLVDGIAPANSNCINQAAKETRRDRHVTLSNPLRASRRSRARRQPSTHGREK
jgi:hypothetical protein